MRGSLLALLLLQCAQVAISKRDVCKTIDSLQSYTCEELSISRRDVSQEELKSISAAVLLSPMLRIVKLVKVGITDDGVGGLTEVWGWFWIF